ncbi:hypothetical protein ACCD08_21820 [Telluria sp. Tellsp104]
MLTRPRQARPDESLGFPSALRAAVRAAVAVVAQDELAPPHGTFDVDVDGATLHIPYRLYYDPARLRRALDDAQGAERRIVACLGTRHVDGHVRQACLAQILDSDEPWLMPYIVQLAGEYVIEIVEDVARWIGTRDASTLASFARANPAWLATLGRRVTSYWNCYHRRAFPDRADYPGTRVLSHFGSDATRR